MIVCELEKEVVAKSKAELIGVGIFDKENPDTLKGLPPFIVKELKQLIAKKQFKAKVGEKRSFSLGNNKELAVIGLGKKEKYSIESLRRSSASLVKYGLSQKVGIISSTLHRKDIKEFDLALRTREAATASIMTIYQFADYKEEKEPLFLKKFIFTFTKEQEKSAVQKGMNQGKIIGRAVNKSRELGNTPANKLNPVTFEQYAKKLAKNSKLSFSVLDHVALKKKGMNLLLAVGNSSDKKPRMLKLEYKPANAKKKIALVGKGITFDSGGLNIKPGRWMEYMKSDMCGAGDVIEVIEAAASLKIPHHIIVLIPLAENLINGAAMRPGDVFKGYGGKTVEVLNTDAEGRLILADAVAYAEDFKPDMIIDIATLTGASISHLGYVGAPVISTSDKLVKVLEDAGKDTYERIWRMPIWEEFEESITSDLADVRNLSKPTGMEAGMITGGLFMKQFIKKTPFIHIDIGGASWNPEGKHYGVKNATGFGVRLLLRFLEKV